MKYVALLFLSMVCNLVPDRSPERPKYHFFDRDLTKIEHPFSQEMLHLIKEIGYYKVIETNDKESYVCEYSFDTQGRINKIVITDIGYGRSEIMLTDSIEYLNDYQLVTKRTQQFLESRADFYYTYDSSKRMIGVKELYYDQKNNLDDDYNYELAAQHAEYSILKSSKNSSKHLLLDASNLIIQRKTNSQDSISFHQQDSSYSEKYWYQRNSKDYLGGERYYKNNKLIKEDLYFKAKYQDTVQPSLWKTNYFFYDENGFLICKKDNKRTLTSFYSYFGHNSLLSKQIDIQKGSIVSVVHYKYLKKKRSIRKLTEQEEMFRLLWQSKFSEAEKIMEKIDTLSWKTLNTCAIITYKKSTSKKELLLGKKWVERSITMQEHPENLSTLSQYYFYLGDRKKALSYIGKALNLARELNLELNEYESKERYFNDLQNKPGLRFK